MKEINYNFREKFLGSAPIKDSQSPHEFHAWTQKLEELMGFREQGPHGYLEIGSYAGESLYYMSQFLNPKSTITLVDLGDNGLARRILTDIVIPHCRNTYNHTIALINGFSNAPATYEAVCKLTPVDRRGYDLCFIDANHIFAHSLEDFQIYRHSANLIAFHDISDETTKKATLKHGVEQANVNHMWRAFKAILPETNEYNEEQIWEFIDPANPKGIGMIHMGALN
jgi:predicted O-methyltransferase YrrM